MSDKLEWLNRHFALLRCSKLDEAVSDEKYECRSDLAEFYKKQNVEDIIWDFADAGRYKCACELMGYVGHHRAVIWWGYQCLLSMYEEFKVNPPPPINIDNIGKSFEPEVPDFAKVELPKPTPEQIKKYNEAKASVKENRQKLKEACDPEIIALYEQYMEVFYREFEKMYGIRPLDLLEKAKKLIQEEHVKGNIDMNSPIFKECEKIKTQLQGVRKETLDTIHAVLPPSTFQLDIGKLQTAGKAVYDWVLAPDDVNSKRCLDAGNGCPDCPPGILAYCAFWAWGDMMAGEKNDFVVKTPTGLMSNGFGKFLMMCALRKGGTRKLKERYEEFFRLGVEVLTGKNLWDKNAISGDVPHERLLEELKNEMSPKKENKPLIQEPVQKPKEEYKISLEELEDQVMHSRYKKEVKKKEYSRWKPDHI